MSQSPMPQPCEIALSVEADEWATELPDAETWCQTFALAALEMADVDLGDHPLEISFLLTSNDAVQVLNRDWRGKDAPTNVLSFAGLDAEDEDALPSGAPLLLGDVILAYGVCRHEAEQQAKPFKDHVAHLVVHGVLHLLGYDHEESEQEAEEMEALETAILAGFHIPDPYAECSP